MFGHYLPNKSEGATVAPNSKFRELNKGWAEPACMRLGGSMRDAGRCLHSLLPVHKYTRTRDCEMWRPWLQMTDSSYLHQSSVDLNFQSKLYMPIHWLLVQCVQVHRLEFSLLNLRCHKYIYFYLFLGKLPQVYLKRLAIRLLETEDEYIYLGNQAQVPRNFIPRQGQK